MLNLAVAASVIMAAVVNHPQKFDLKCQITAFQHDSYDARKEKTPLLIRLKVDLITRRFCVAVPPQQGLEEMPCTESAAVKSVKPTVITLDRPHDGGTTTINRETGAYLSDYTAKGANFPPFRVRVYGKCEAQPFTGLPGTQF